MGRVSGVCVCSHADAETASDHSRCVCSRISRTWDQGQGGPGRTRSTGTGPGATGHLGASGSWVRS
eukprot:scaffold72451_cov54-Phaeocystis_antarctica.AAC.3